MDANCTLSLELGRVEVCSREVCVFWDDGCALDRLGLDTRGYPGLASYLLDLRDRFEASPRPGSARSSRIGREL